MWFLTINIDLHSIKRAVYNVYKHQGSETAQYGLEIILKIYYLLNWSIFSSTQYPWSSKYLKVCKIQKLFSHFSMLEKIWGNLLQSLGSLQAFHVLHDYDNHKQIERTLLYFILKKYYVVMLLLGPPQMSHPFVDWGQVLSLCEAVWEKRPLLD